MQRSCTLPRNVLYCKGLSLTRRLTIGLSFLEFSRFVSQSSTLREVATLAVFPLFVLRTGFAILSLSCKRNLPAWWGSRESHFLRLQVFCFRMHADSIF